VGGAAVPATGVDAQTGAPGGWADGAVARKHEGGERAEEKEEQRQCRTAVRDGSVTVSTRAPGVAPLPQGNRAAQEGRPTGSGNDDTRGNASAAAACHPTPPPKPTAFDCQPYARARGQRRVWPSPLTVRHWFCPLPPRRQRRARGRRSPPPQREGGRPRRRRSKAVANDSRSARCDASVDAAAAGGAVAAPGGGPPSPARVVLSKADGGGGWRSGRPAGVPIGGGVPAGGGGGGGGGRGGGGPGGAGGGPPRPPGGGGGAGGGGGGLGRSARAGESRMARGHAPPGIGEVVSARRWRAPAPQGARAPPPTARNAARRGRGGQAGQRPRCWCDAIGEVRSWRPSAGARPDLWGQNAKNAQRTRCWQLARECTLWSACVLQRCGTSSEQWSS